MKKVKTGSEKRHSINQCKGWGKWRKVVKKRSSINQYKGWRKWRKVVKKWDIQSINKKDKESEER
jgi:hypothetical protein